MKNLRRQTSLLLAIASATGLTACESDPPFELPDAGPGVIGAEDGGTDSRFDGGPGDAGLDAGPKADAGSGAGDFRDAGTIDAGSTEGGTLTHCTWEAGPEVDLSNGLHFSLTWSTADDDLDILVTKTDGDLCTSGTNGRDLDDTNGFGPENVAIPSASNGTYSAWAHFYEGGSTTATITVRAGTDPVGVCTIDLAQHQLWRAVNVDVLGSAGTLTEPEEVQDEFSCSTP